MVAVVGSNTSLVGAPAVTVKAAVATANPLAETVTVAVPVVVGVRLDVALPPVGATGEAGLKVPDTPLTEKPIEFVAVATVLPLASWMVAV